jgi:predicted nucleic acid-binding protein
MADAMILATAHLYHAELITSDGDFESLPGVRYLPKPKS